MNLMEYVADPGDVQKIPPIRTIVYVSNYNQKHILVHIEILVSVCVNLAICFWMSAGVCESLAVMLPSHLW